MNTTGGVAGIHVRVFIAASSYYARAVTGPDGYYNLHGLAPGNYDVQFFDPTHHYRPQWSGGAWLFVNASAVTVGPGTTWSNALLGT